MNKTELESKHLAELHALAADAGVERYRMLPRAELIETLAGATPQAEPKPSGGGRGETGQRRQRDRGRKPREPRRAPRQEAKPEREAEQAPAKPEREATAAEPAAAPGEGGQRKRKRRRRRWGRRRKGVRIQDLLLPAASGRQAIVYAESREGCTALLREVAAELAGASEGPDPIALLIDPSPEELADWKREAPQAELVSAGQARHANDALAQATLRANGGEDVIVLIDSLSRFAEDFADADDARELFDAGLAAASATNGSLTVVAALQRG